MLQTDIRSFCGTPVNLSDYKRDINADLCHGDINTAMDA